MNRKNMLIREAQKLIAEHNENIDYRTKVLYDKFRFAVLIIQGMSENQLAQAVIMLKSEK